LRGCWWCERGGKNRDREGPRASDDLRQRHEREEGVGKDFKSSGHGSFTVRNEGKRERKERNQTSQLSSFCYYMRLYTCMHAREQIVCFRHGRLSHAHMKKTYFQRPDFQRKLTMRIHTRGPHVLSLLCQSPCALIYFTLCHAERKLFHSGSMIS